jgi:hypothetical protein
VLAASSLTSCCAAALLAAACGSSFTAISNSPAGASETSLAAFPDGLAAAWNDTRDGRPEIYTRRIDANGRAEGPERRLTFGPAAAYEADVEALSRDMAIGWYEKDAAGHPAPRLGVWGRDGSRRWIETLAPAGRNTVVRGAHRAIFAAWIEDEEDDRAGVWAGWWREDGTALIPPRRLADAGKTTWSLNAAIDPASSPGRPRAWIAFDAKAGTRSEELFLVDAGETSQNVTRLTSDDGAASKYPDISFSGNHVGITWFDVKDGNEEIYLFAGTRQQLEHGGDLPAQRVTTTSGHSVGAYLAWNGDQIGLAWCDDSQGQHEVYFQTFDTAGRARAAAVRVTHTAASSWMPAIAPWKEGFALAWNEFEFPGGEAHQGDGRSQIAFTFLH